MSLHNLLLLAFLIPIVTCQPTRTGDNQLTVMTFNIWQSGINVDDGMRKIAKHISLVNPDAVALQEVASVDVVRELASMLGEQWTGLANGHSRYPDSGILTRHPVVNGSVNASECWIGARISLAHVNRTIHFYSTHQDYRSYGPYAAFNKLVTSPIQIMAGERNVDGHGRFENMRSFLLDEDFRAAVSKADDEPLLVCGDFNAPSHLDWTNRTKKIHGGWTFEWPATKMLQEEAEMEDSFRKVHPDPLLEQGITWSTVEKTSSAGWGWTIPEPQDRIDFIFYKSPSLTPVSSFTYKGREVVWPKPYHVHNDYPSDHAAVVTVFDIQ